MPGLSPARPAVRRDDIFGGILAMVVSTVIFAVINTVVKWEVALYPVGEVAFFRSSLSLIPCYLLILPRTGLAVLRTRRLGDHCKRGLSQFGSTLCLILAFTYMPLAGAVAITFASPLFTTLLSAWVLKEAVGRHRWAALLLGLLGVLLMTHPGAGSLQPGAVFALGNALFVATVAIAIRRMSMTESTDTLLIYQLTLVALCTAFLLPFGFVVPTWQDALLLAFAGIANGFGQYFWTKALCLAPASAVAPFNYLSLIWASVIGFLIWGDLPAVSLVIGSAIVVGSGLYLLWRETAYRRRRAKAVS